MSDFNFTHHPLPIRLLNSVRPGLEKLGMSPGLSASRLTEKANRRTGLSDFGSDWTIEPLEVLLSSINNEADLSVLGRIIVQKRLLDILINRLRAEQLFKTHSEILDVTFERILVIAGLQRTGTTLLHRLLASNPDIRASLSWEVLNPVPLDKELNRGLGPVRRIRQAKIAQFALKYIAPTFFAIHPVEYDMPEEDVLFLDASFMSQSWEATLNVPSYSRWLETQDQTPAYAYLKKLMQLLLWQNRARHIVLKSPHHMEHLDAIIEVFPSATIIQTHRDPQKTMASFVSMVANGSGIFSDEVDVQRIAAHWRRKIRRMIDRSNEVRVRSPETRFVDVSYRELVGDPIRQLKNIYKKVGIAFDDDVERTAAVLLDRQVQNKYGRHSYSLKTFEMTEAQLEEDFGDYRAQFDIPQEESNLS